MMNAKKIGPMILVACMLVASLEGCAATRQRRGTPESTGFLGDYSQLKESPDFAASLVYVRPGVQWSAYHAIQLDSVGLWTDEQTSGASQEDRQMLTDMLYNTLTNQLGRYFMLVREPATDAVRLRVALTQASGAKPVLRAVTTIVPQLRLAGSLIGLGLDTATMVGSARIEMEMLDEGTNQRLAAAVDERAGTKVLFAKRAYTTWGDVQAACDWWAKRIAWQLGRHGVQLKPGAKMPPEPEQPRTI